MRFLFALVLPVLAYGCSIGTHNGLLAAVTATGTDTFGQASVIISAGCQTGDVLSAPTTAGVTISGGTACRALFFAASTAKTPAAWATILRTTVLTTIGGDGIIRTLTWQIGLTYGGHAYDFTSTAVTWTDAKTASELRTIGGAACYLAEVGDAAENTFINNNVAGNAWLGGTDTAADGTWLWTKSGDPVTFTFWNAGEPNGLTTENCMQMLAGGTGKWNDLDCNGPVMPAVVECSGGSPPSGTATCTPAAVQGDPHFTSLSGGEYDVNGENFGHYALVSSRCLQLNVQFVPHQQHKLIEQLYFEKFQQPLPHPVQYVGELTLVVENHQSLTWSAESAFEPALLGNCSTKPLPNDPHQLEVSCPDFRFVIAQQPTALGVPNPHLNIVNVTIGASRAPIHGLLGQTWHLTKPVSDASFLQGSVADYKIPSQSATSFAFTRYAC